MTSARHPISEPTHFVLVGSVTTVIQYCVLIAGVQWFGIRAYLASTLGYFVAAAVSYFLNYYLTFRSTANHATAVIRFVIMTAGGLALNFVLMRRLTTGDTSPYLLAQILTTLLVLAWNYFLSSLWVYRSKQ